MTLPSPVMDNQSKIAFVSVSALILLSACAGSRDLHARPEAAFGEQISQAIPSGTPIREAETLLTSRGYSCARTQGPGAPASILSCIDQGATVGSFAERIWHIQLTYDAAGKVIDIDANISRAFAL